MCARENMLESNRKRREWLKSHGWCLDCGAKAEPEKQFCSECLRKRREYMKEYFEQGRRKSRAKKKA